MLCSIIVQGPLVEYDFKVKDLFKDLQDGLKLCRAIQLLQHDASILTVGYLIFVCGINFNSFGFLSATSLALSIGQKRNFRSYF